MANAITLAAKFVPLLDKAYAATAKTAILNAAPSEVRPTDNVGTYSIQKLTLVGLGTYSKTLGAPAGDVTLTWESFTYTQDRGRKFTVDALDEKQAMGAFGKIAGEFMRRYEVPEIDAYRIAKIATTCGTDVAATLTTGAATAAALNLADVTLQNAEVEGAELVLFITPTFLGLAKTQALNTAVPIPVLDNATVVVVPQSRMKTAITVDAGAAGNAGGYAVAAGAENVQFILMDKNAVFADAKHESLRVFDDKTNQAANAWLFDFRIVHDCFVFEEKLNGVYVNTADPVV